MSLLLLLSVLNILRNCCQYLPNSFRTVINAILITAYFRLQLFGIIHGDHLSGKPGNVREFGTCHGNVSDVVNSQGNVREKILSGKSVPKLFITR